MEWTEEAIARLYRLHTRMIDSLREDVAGVNRSLGSLNATEDKLPRLTLAEFSAMLRRGDEEPEIVQLWVRRIARGHEEEFPELQAAG